MPLKQTVQGSIPWRPTQFSLRRSTDRTSGFEPEDVGSTPAEGTNIILYMCFKIKCKKCGKFTWAGCGEHIEQVLKDIPEEERCHCPREEENKNEEKQNSQE